MPTSAWASAGASLMPSPAIATTRPSPCSFSTSFELVRGLDLAMDLVDAQSLPPPAPSSVRRPWPSRRGRRPAQRRQRLGVVALIGSDTASRPARCDSTARYITLAPCSRNASALGGQRRQSTAELLHQRGVAEGERLSARRCRARRCPVVDSNSLGVSSVRPCSRAAADDRAGQRMLAALIEARGQTQDLGSVQPPAAIARSKRRSAFGQRAGLVDDERIDLAQVLDRRGVAEETRPASQRGRWRP